MEAKMRRVVVFGGAGFIGSNLSKSFLDEGTHVTVFDSVARRGRKLNIAWLRQCYSSGQLDFINDDIRNAVAVRAVVKDADAVYQLAGQVAVTTSVQDPRTDFEINTLGTLNVLEGVRLSGRRPPVIFTSTNKVYGALEYLRTREGATRYEFRDLVSGVPESQPLDFHSPYGC